MTIKQDLTTLRECCGQLLLGTGPDDWIQQGFASGGLAALSRIEAAYRTALELCDNWVIQAGEYHRQRDALKAALERIAALSSPKGTLPSGVIARQALTNLNKEEAI